MSWALIALSVSRFSFPTVVRNIRRFLGLVVEPRRPDVLSEVALEVVADGDLAGLAALVVEVKERLLVALVEVSETELRQGARPSGRIDERRDDGPVLQADDILHVEGCQERAGVLVADLGGFAFEDLVALGLGDRRGIQEDEVALDEEIEETAKRRDVLLFGRRRARVLPALSVLSRLPADGDHREIDATASPCLRRNNRWTSTAGRANFDQRCPAGI